MRTCREAAGRQPRAVRPSVRPVVSHAAVATWSARRALDWQGPFLGDVGVAPLRRMPDTDAILTVTRHLKFLKVISREINI